MGKILVKASPQIQIGPDGKPQMYYNVGFGGRRGGGDGARGRTTRNIIGRYGGGALGALGGLAGESRSLGGFLSNLQVGAMQGAAAGGGLANFLTSRRRQARADLIEGQKQAQAKDDAQARLRGEEEYARRPGLQRRAVGPFANVASPEQGFMRRVSRRNMTDFGRQIQQEEMRLQEEAKERARQQKILDRRGFKGTVDDFFTAARNMPSQEVVNVASQLQNVQPAPVGQQPQVPQQIQPAEGGAQTQSDENNNAMGTGPQAVQSHTNASTENAEQEVQEQQGGGDEGDSEMLNRLRGMMEGENE